MPLARPTNQIYINRELDFLIEEKITNKTSKVLFVHGQGGVGKSTLLKNLLSYGSAKKIPTVLINIQDNPTESFVDILLDEDITTVKHCPNFEKIRTILLKEPKLLNVIIKSNTDVLESKIKEYDEEWGEYAKIAIDFTKAGAKFLKSGEEKKKKEFLNNPEMVLLSALAEDFEQYGLFMLDTFEKIKNANIKSKINFDDNGEISMRLREKNYRLRDYVEGLIYLLVENSTFIIAGRNSQNELNMKIPSEFTDELSLKNFSSSDIKTFFKRYKEKGLQLSLPTEEQLAKVTEITNGNPLKVSLFLKMAKEYDSWEAFDFEQMEERVREDERYGLLFYMTDRVLSHLDEHKDIWKLVIPRVLTVDIEKELFKDDKILNKFIDMGLATRGRDTDWKRYHLHDDVHSAIVAYFEREFKGNFSSWHDSEPVAKLHRELMEFYAKREDSYGVNSAFEVCYHKIMLKHGFETEFTVKREAFAGSVLGSLILSVSNKNSICQDWNSIESSKISEYIQSLQNEKDRFIISSKLYDVLSKALSNATIDEVEDVAYLRKLSKNEFKKDWSVFYVMGNAYYKLKKYAKAIECYEKALAINPKRDKAYYNMGIVYYKLKEYIKAIECYEKALAINPKKDEAYYTMGIAYYWLGDYTKVIECYINALHINPNKSEAYTNLFELQLTQKQAFHQVLEKQYIELFEEQKESFMKYEMLKIFQIIAGAKDADVKGWVQRYRDVDLESWSFDELREWIDGVEDAQIKARLLEALEVFEGHGK